MGRKRQKLSNLYVRFNRVCQICGEKCTRKEASREHVVRRADGGAGTRDNVVLAHKKCNWLKGQADEIDKIMKGITPDD